MEEKRRKKFTDEDIKVIKKHLNNHPDNIKKAFKLASEEIGHSYYSISSSYYHRNSKIAVALSNDIVTMSNKKVVRGRKNSSSFIRPKNVCRRTMKSILSVLFND